MIARRLSRPAYTLAALLCCGALALACSDSAKDTADGSVAGKDSKVAGKDGATGPDSTAADTSCDPTFGQAKACGGDVEGKWTYVKGCVPKEAFDGIKKACKGATVSNDSTSAAGSLTFSKGSYSMDTSVVMSADFTIGGACLALLKTCKKVENTVKLLVLGSKVTCVDATGGCDCKITMTWAAKWMGQYTAAGGKTTLKTGQEYHYCVKGDVMRYRGVPTNASDKTATYVLVRQ